VIEQLLAVGVEVLRLIPLILALYLPAVMGLVLLKERGEGYKAKAAAVFVLGFGLILLIHVIFTSVSALQVTGTLVLALVQIAVALLLAFFTVYRLAD
jgi:hypothetical protein